MKPTLIPLVALCAVASVQAQGAPYGVEFVSGIRTGYIQRGLNLADDLLDLQIQSNITLTKTTDVNLALWQGAEISGDFREFGALVGLNKRIDQFSVFAEVSLSSYESDIVSGGVEFSLGGDYTVTEFVSVFAHAGYNSGAESIFGQFGGIGSMRLTDKAFLEGKLQLNAADNYFGREGLYDATARISVTTNINDSLSVTPFFSLSTSLDGEGEDLETSLGVWVELFF